ncbi:MAG: TrmB family transcriptional regulator [Nitrososphaerota archaeon]|jgi:sugar-specific transcriptional regulator TrmB|nr:TrmB family transcriptional regulator [Nitrososphaerota archaeon]MDG7054018.1 TrmB family transcriptional regulator [Nitrososphaerota archaeon]
MLENGSVVDDNLSSGTQNDDWAELILQLSSILDLETVEARIYLNLLRLGPVTASSLAKELDVDRTKTYRTIDKLLNMSIVSTTISNPKLCIATKPEEVLKIVLQKKQDDINRVEKIGKNVIQKINKIVPITDGHYVPTFRTVQGRANIYSHIEKLLEDSSRMIYIVTTAEDILRMYHTAVPEKIKECIDKGGTVRILTSTDDNKFIPLIERLKPTETRLGKLPSKGRIIVEDGKQMIMSDVMNASDFANMENSRLPHDSFSIGADTDFALWTNSAEMVNNIFSLCKFLWRTSKPLRKLDIKK